MTPATAYAPSARDLCAPASRNLAGGWAVTAGMGTPSIGSMPIATYAGRLDTWGTTAWRAPALLTRRRTVNYCRLATTLCPWPPRGRQAA